MNLQDQGFRYIYRRSAHPDCGIWIRPEFIKPGDVDCTDMSDDDFEAMVNTLDNEQEAQ